MMLAIIAVNVLHLLTSLLFSHCCRPSSDEPKSPSPVKGSPVTGSPVKGKVIDEGEDEEKGNWVTGPGSVNLRVIRRGGASHSPYINSKHG